jgi:hypothetical protein
MASGIEVKEQFLALCRAVELRERQSLTFEQPGPSVDDGGAVYTHFRLMVGYGYFTGSLLSVEGRDINSNLVWRRMKQLPLEQGVEWFLRGTVPAAV